MAVDVSCSSVSREEIDNRAIEAARDGSLIGSRSWESAESEFLNSVILRLFTTDAPNAMQISPKSVATDSHSFRETNGSNDCRRTF
jgi:hypothetical protein